MKISYELARGTPDLHNKIILCSVHFWGASTVQIVQSNNFYTDTSMRHAIKNVDFARKHKQKMQTKQKKQER